MATPILSIATQRKVERLADRISRLARFQQLIISAVVPLLEIGNHHPHLAIKFGELMAKTQDELVAEIGSLKQAIADDSASDQAVVAQLDKVIEDLKAQVAAGQQIDTDALFAALEDAKTGISTVTSPNAGGDIGSVNVSG